MRPRIFCFLLAIAASTAVMADFDSASNAYKSQNYAVAFEEFSELAKAGDPRAQTVLAIMYKYGESVEVDLTQSYDWYMKAAKSGYPPAQYNIGIMLLNGTGVEQNENAAERWLRKAATSGFERANHKLAELKGSKLILHDEEPVAWSHNWNLRLPNTIREESANDLMQLLVYRVQIGAMSTLNGAEKLWQQLFAKNGDLFQGQQPIFRERRSGDRTVYRVQLGPFDEKAEADRWCEAYNLHFTNRSGCLVIQTN